jgi:hypothetical protein
MNEEKKLVGRISVDAGICWVGDPCYLEAAEPFKDWEKFCTSLGTEYPTMKAFPHSNGTQGLGVVVQTGCGDGSYPVYARVENNIVTSVTVEFT